RARVGNGAARDCPAHASAGWVAAAREADCREVGGLVLPKCEDFGEMTSRQTALASGPVSAIGFSQADSVASASAAVEKTTHRSLSIASRRESLCMNVIVLRPRYS